MDFDFEFHLSFKIFEESLELKLVSCQSVALGHSLEHSDVLIHQVLENKEVVDQRRQLHKRQAAPVVRHFAIFNISVQGLYQPLRIVVHPCAVVPVEINLKLPRVEAVGPRKGGHHGYEPDERQHTGNTNHESSEIREHQRK